MFDRKQFEATITAVAERFAKSAPTVADWCDWLNAAGDSEVTLADVVTLKRLAELHDPSKAANYLCHREVGMGRSVVGQLGF